jgi:hypothetical protein
LFDPVSFDKSGCSGVFPFELAEIAREEKGVEGDGEKEEEGDRQKKSGDDKEPPHRT